MRVCLLNPAPGTQGHIDPLQLHLIVSLVALRILALSLLH